jgi:signal transduction histidine kinase
MVLQTVLDDLQVALKESKGEVIIKEHLGTIEGDEGQIRQLFQNLIGNALKYHREHIPPIIKIDGQLDGDGKAYQIIVEDNGIGFKEEYYERIFEPFQRLHGVSLYPGTGMGLTICKKIVERHKGGIKVISKPGQGSQFSFTLPTTSSQRL